MNQHFLKFYLFLSWGLSFIVNSTPRLHRNKPEFKVGWLPVALSILRFVSMIIVLTNNLFKDVDLSIELVVVRASTLLAELIAGAGVQIISMLHTADTYRLFQYCASKGPTTKRIPPAVIASAVAMMVLMGDVIFTCYFFPVRGRKLEIFHGTFLYSYFPVVALMYFMTLMTSFLATPFALLYVIVFGLEFTEAYEHVCDELVRFSHVIDRNRLQQKNHLLSVKLQVMSVKRTLRVGKRYHRKYIKTTRIYNFCLLVDCCLTLLYYLTYNIANSISQPLNFSHSTYAVMSIVILFLLAYTGNAAESRVSRATYDLQNAREFCTACGNKKILRIIKWVSSWNVRLSALGCVDVNYGMISTVFTVVFTYSICCLQMQLTPKH